MKAPSSRLPMSPPTTATPPRPAPGAPPGPYEQGKAHVSNPGAVERSAAEAAEKAARAGKPAPEGSTPGGVSS
jgi:hypothetical protein